MAAAVTEKVSKLPEKDAHKQQLLAKVAALENRAQSLERERNSHLFSKRSEFRPLFCGLEEAELKYGSDRRNEKQELKQSIARIHSSVATFQRMLTDMKPGPTYVEALKKAMEDIESAIASFKERQRKIYEQLLQEEKSVSTEVTAFEKKLDSWMTTKTPHTIAGTAHTGTLATRPGQPTPSSVPPAVLAFERFLQQTGGREGGWEDYDHQTFIRIRSKFNGHPSYMEAAASELPTKSMEEIRQHDQWYSEFCALLGSKKKAIESWKKQKQSIKLAPSIEVDKVETKTRSKEELLAKEREERLKKLSEWKVQQEAKRQHEEEEKRLRAEADRLKEAEREQKRKTALRAQVAEYARQKELASLMERELREAERSEEAERRRAATKEVERFRERDFRELASRKEKAKKKEEEAKERMIALEKTKAEVRVERDPTRLYKLTAGWEERKKAGVGESGGGPLLSLPRRAVPSWRQGLH